MDGPAYDDFYAAMWPRLVRTAYAVSGDLGVAEDAAQVALAKAYRSWRRVSRADAPQAYVRRMTVNEVLNHHRRASSRRESARAELPETVHGSEDPALVHDEVWRALLTLPPRQRAVLVLRYYEDLTEQEIADALGCRPGTVKSQASDALTSLRARLEVDRRTEEGTR